MRRGGKDSTHRTGKGPEGNSRFYKTTDQVNEDGLIERTYPDYFKISFDKKNCNGAILELEVQFLKATETPNGAVQSVTALPIRYYSEWQDIVDFVNAYGVPIMMHLMNGLETAGEGFYGLKVFTPTGADADPTYSEAEKEAAPTKLHNGYHGIPGTNGPV